MNANPFLDPARAGVFFLPSQYWEAALALAAGAGRQTETVRLASCDKEAVLGELGTALSFPDWYGANFDALYDCLTEPDRQPASGQVLLISGLDNPKDADPESFAILIDVFVSAADARRDAGQPLWILLDTPTPDLPELPVR